eukprot:scaffold44274_cov248-Skeletonema_marinoi.AAC.1
MDGFVKEREGASKGPLSADRVHADTVCLFSSSFLTKDADRTVDMDHSTHNCNVSSQAYAVQYLAYHNRSLGQTIDVVGVDTSLFMHGHIYVGYGPQGRSEELS